MPGRFGGVAFNLINLVGGELEMKAIIRCGWSAE